jgi:capsular polysaccharide biosynthesis protein
VTVPLDERDDGPKRPWFDDDVAVGDGASEFSPSLVSLGFIRAALRRSKWFWRITAVVGLLLSAGVYLAIPPTYQATTTLLLNVGPESQPGTAILNDQTYAQSRGVAGLAVKNLRLRQSVSSFLGSYTVTVITDRVLSITVSGSSDTDAVRRANGLAQAYLTFRTGLLRTQQQLQTAGYDQQVTQLKQYIKLLSSRISRLSAQPRSPKQQAELNALRAQRDSSNGNLTQLAQATAVNKAATQETTASMISQSKVLDAASPLAPHSRVKHLVLFAGVGFMFGLIVGVGIVVVRALVSDRLRRRDDVARALGAPVRISVPATRAQRRRFGRPGLAAGQGRDMQRIVAYLGDAVPRRSRGPAALAVVPVDDPQVAALCLASLAVSWAHQGRRVVVADLCGGAPAATLLGAKEPGVGTVTVDGAHLAVAVPDPEEVVPTGPFSRTSRQDQATLASQVAAASRSADVLLTLMTLDPSIGGDHLATWAADAVVVVTAGRSSWEKIQGVGEMIRLAGARLVSAALVGSDKTDESLGVLQTPEAEPAAESVAETAGRQSRPDVEASFATVTGDQGARASGDPRRYPPVSR